MKYEVKLYRRHIVERACSTHTKEGFQKDCKDCVPACKFTGKPQREADCGCAVWLRTNVDGKQRRWSSKTTDWAEARGIARQEELELSKRDGKSPAAEEQPKTVAEAIAAFIAFKETGELAEDTKERLELTLERLQFFCDRERIVNIADLTAAHLSAWRSDWTVKTFHAKTTFESRVKAFLNYCYTNELIAKDLCAACGKEGNKALHTARGKAKDDDAVRPLSAEEYQRVLSAIEETEMSPENKIRVNLCMRLQRESGLALVDAVTLAEEELKKADGYYLVDKKRQKTGSPIEVPVSLTLGDALMKLKNGNPQYFFWSGKTERSDAPKTFQKHYRRVAKTLDFSFSSHDLRHTFAVESLKAGLTLRQLSKALGHSSVKITESFYAKWSTEEKDVLKNALQASLKAQSMAQATA